MKKAQHRTSVRQLLDGIRQRALDLAADCDALAAELEVAQLSPTEAVVARKLDEVRCFARSTNRKHGYRCLRPQDAATAPFCARHAGSKVVWPGAPPEVALEFLRRAMGMSPAAPSPAPPPAELVAALGEPEPAGPRCPDCDHPALHAPGQCDYPSDADDSQAAAEAEPPGELNPELPEDGPGEPLVEPSAVEPEPPVMQPPPIREPTKGGFSSWLAKRREAEGDYEGCSTCGDSGVLKERIGTVLTSRPCPTCNPAAEQAEAAGRTAVRMALGQEDAKWLYPLTRVRLPGSETRPEKGRSSSLILGLATIGIVCLSCSIRDWGYAALTVGAFSLFMRVVAAEIERSFVDRGDRHRQLHWDANTRAAKLARLAMHRGSATGEVDNALWLLTRETRADADMRSFKDNAGRKRRPRPRRR